MSGFEILHPAVQFQIVNALGWHELRPNQDRAVGPILEGKNVIILAPTAGGKTEAAVFPILSRMLEEGWVGLSVVYVCPIKALLNNLLFRLERYASLLGRRVAVWHGDVGEGARGAIVSNPPDILLTTPESLEVMLVSKRVTKEHLFEYLQVVIVDEVHSFLGDDRGWQLLSVLERVNKIAGRDIQRIGLSATVGNAQDLLKVFAGGSERATEVVAPSQSTGSSADVLVDYVGSISNAAKVIAQLHGGAKRLVFCDSRAQCEELASALRVLHVQTFVSHSSLSLDERRQSEEAFASARDCVIVATSTLELGIDVGDLDHVIQINAPATVSSFLQRLGRTGRRPGTKRNCLFLALSEDAFLHSCGLVALWDSGFVEPVVGPVLPYHVFAQQYFSLVLQEGAIAPQSWAEWFGNMAGFREWATENALTIFAHMLRERYIGSDGKLVICGDRGEEDYGYKFLIRILSVFETPELLKVVHGRKELGLVDELSLKQKRDDDPVTLLLAGHSWTVNSIDWARRVIHVSPAPEGGRSRWSGVGRTMSYELCQAMKRLLLCEDVPDYLTERGRGALKKLRGEFAWLRDSYNLIQDEGGNRVRYWTFAGTRANLTLSALLEERLAKTVKFDHLGVYVRGASKIEFEQALSAIKVGQDALCAPNIPEQYLPSLKFREMLPERLAYEAMRARATVPVRFLFEASII